MTGIAQIAAYSDWNRAPFDLFVWQDVVLTGSLFLWFLCPPTLFCLFEFSSKREKNEDKTCGLKFQVEGELIQFLNLGRKEFCLMYLSRTSDWDSESSNLNVGQVLFSLSTLSSSLMESLDLDSARSRFELSLTDWCKLGNIMLLASFVFMEGMEI